MIKPWMAAMVALAVIFTSHVSLAEKRVALVIGNGDYAFAPLANPKNDAMLMARTLRGLGFDVIEILNATQKQMKRAVRAFGKKLDAAGKDGVGLFYYAGHGVQVKEANYMIPVDAVIDTEGDVDIEAIDTQAVLAMMEFSDARLSFVIMDACRNNPFKRGFRSGTRGLARMEAPTGSLIAYATAPGDVAADGAGGNSPYTAALATMMNRPALSVERMFREVRNIVRDQTKGQQTPWESSSLTGGDFYFNRGGTNPRVAATPAPQAALAPQGAPAVDKEALFWRSIQDSNDPNGFRAYLGQFPNGMFASLARIKLGKLDQKADRLNRWNGSWQTDFGMMSLTVSGLTVSGRYDWDQGRIEGRLSENGGKLIGTWREEPTFSPPDDGGGVEFALSEDGDKITGRWWFGDDRSKAPPPRNTWSGIRAVKRLAQ